MTEAVHLSMPGYDFDFSGPVRGVNHFGYDEPRKTFQKDLNGEGYACKIDRSVVKKKFELLDWCEENAEKLSNNPELMSTAKRLLKDSNTIFAYKYFRLHGKRLKLRWYQDVVISDRSRRVLYVAANQTGKSVTLDTDAASEFMKDHGKEWRGLLVSNALQQSKERMANIRQLIATSGISVEELTDDTKTGQIKNMTGISFTFYEELPNGKKRPMYTNKLICCPHTSSALGYPCDDMWLDEFAYWDNCDKRHFLQRIAIPRTFETKGSIRIYSNPNGKDDYLYELYNQKDKKGKRVWHAYQFNYWDRIDANQEEFDSQISGMTKLDIESTLLAIFGRGAGSFFSREEIDDMLDTELTQKGDNAGFGRETAWFLDVGTVHDQSVLVGVYAEKNPDSEDFPLIKAFYIHKYPVGYPLSRVIGIERVEEDGWEDSAEENPSVKEVLADYAEKEYDEKGEVVDTFMPLFGCDVTGNEALIPLLENVGIDAVPIKFSLQSKWKMYQRYRYYTEQRWLKRAMDRDYNTVNGKDFSYQAGKLIEIKAMNSSIKRVRHESEEDLDDTQDAMVGAIHMIENPDISSLRYDIITTAGESLIDQETGTIKEEKEKMLKDQYIPDFMKGKEFNSWIEKKISERR